MWHVIWWYHCGTTCTDGGQCQRQNNTEWLCDQVALYLTLGLRTAQKCPHWRVQLCVGVRMSIRDSMVMAALQDLTDIFSASYNHDIHDS